MLTMCEVLDVLPANHPDRQEILDLLCKLIDGVAARQGTSGFWHQLLDRPDTYEETSATAIYAYCMAHAINQGWVNDKAYGPVIWAGAEIIKLLKTHHPKVNDSAVEFYDEEIKTDKAIFHVK